MSHSETYLMSNANKLYCHDKIDSLSLKKFYNNSELFKQKTPNKAPLFGI